MNRRTFFMTMVSALGVSVLLPKIADQPRPMPRPKPPGSDGELHIEHQNRVYDTLHQQVFS